MLLDCCFPDYLCNLADELYISAWSLVGPLSVGKVSLYYVQFVFPFLYRGIEPRSMRILGKCSTAGPHAHAC